MAEARDKDKCNELRSRAQDFLTPHAEAVALSSEETGRLAHELATYQIELELQNEDLRNAQIELEQSRHSYADLYDYAPVGYLIVNDKGIVLEANLTAATLLGVERSVLLKQPLSSFVLSEDQDIYYLHIKQTFAEGAPQSCRLRMLRADATHLDVMLHTVTATAADNAPVCRTALIDCSALKLAEDEINRNNEFMKDVIESLPHPFLVIDANDYTIKLANSAALSGNATKATTCYALSHKRDKPCEGTAHACPLEEIRKTKKPVILEHIHYDQEGNLKNVEVHGSPIFDKQGNVIQITEYFLDITERKEIGEALQASEERFRLILDSTAEAIYGLDNNGNCTFCNSVCVRVLGYKEKQDLMGRNMHNLAHHTLPDGSPHNITACKIYKAFQENKGTHVEDEVFWHRDGTSFPVEYWSYPMIEENNVVGGVVTFIDITERKKTEEDLRRKMEELERFSRMAIGREKEMIRLKDEVNSLLTELGREAKYKIVK